MKQLYVCDLTARYAVMHAYLAIIMNPHLEDLSWFTSNSVACLRSINLIPSQPRQKILPPNVSQFFCIHHCRKKQT